MEQTYVICWKTRDNERAGQGKKLFTREEAEALAEELNRDYPNFIHEAIHIAAANLCSSPIMREDTAEVEEVEELDEETETEVAEEEEEEPVHA